MQTNIYLLAHFCAMTVTDDVTDARDGEDDVSDCPSPRLCRKHIGMVQSGCLSCLHAPSYDGASLALPLVASPSSPALPPFLFPALFPSLSPVSLSLFPSPAPAHAVDPLLFST